jgi:hypothetical protein
MKAVLNKLLLFLAILLALVAASNWLAKKSICDDSHYKIVAGKENLILGHSYTECGLNDSLIDNTINLSQGGESYFYTYQKLRKIIAANPAIKTVFISFSNNQIHERMDKWVWDDKYIDNNLPRYNCIIDWPGYKLLLAHNTTAVLRSELTVIKNGMRNIGKTPNFIHDRSIGGYLFLRRNKVDSLLKTDFLAREKRDIKLKVSQTNVDYLRKIADFCDDHHINLYFVRMPMRPDSPFLKIDAQYDSIKKTKFADVTLLDFKNYPTPTEECGDLEHFNYKGARKFSVFFNDLLSRGILTAPGKQQAIDRAITALTIKDSIR